MTLVLADLPLPQVLEEIDFETIVARKKNSFKALWEAVRTNNPALNLPEWDVQMLETDPVVVIIEADAYDEMLLRARVNDAVRSNILGLAVRNDLERVAADHGVTRLTGESDKALEERIVLADQGRSTAGPKQWYEFHARTADVRVKDVAVYRKGSGPELGVAVLSTDNDGVPTQDILDAVDAAINTAAVRSINDVITVESAIKQVVDVSAEIWLLPDAPASVFEGLEARLEAALIEEGGIGFDGNRSWMIAKLSPAGVSKVNLLAPVSDIVMDGNSALTFGTITMTLMGRSR